MPGKTALASLCLAAILLGALIAGCGKDYKQVAVINGDKAEIVTYGNPPKEEGKVWEAGRVLVFRTELARAGRPGQRDRQGGAHLPSHRRHGAGGSRRVPAQRAERHARLHLRKVRRAVARLFHLPIHDADHRPGLPPDRELEDVGPAVVPGDVELPARPPQAARVHLGVEDLLAVRATGSTRNLPSGSTIALSPGLIHSLWGRYFSLKA